jgi:hypothetical protein
MPLTHREIRSMPLVFKHYRDASSLAFIIRFFLSKLSIPEDKTASKSSMIDTLSIDIMVNYHIFFGIDHHIGDNYINNS